MNSRTIRRFRETFSRLPDHVQKQARHSFRLLRQDLAHPGLHFKQIHPDPPLYSARVGLGYRAVASRDGDTLVWFWIGPRAEYNHLLTQL
jgi:hypothetical protein